MELYEIHSNPTEQGEDHMLLLWGTCTNTVPRQKAMETVQYVVQYPDT